MTFTLDMKNRNYDTTVSTGHMKTRVPKSLYSVNAAEIEMAFGQSAFT